MRLDTNILIDSLGGIEPARLDLARFTDEASSPVTRTDVMQGATSEACIIIRRVLASLKTIAVDSAVGRLPWPCVGNPGSSCRTRSSGL